MSRSNDRTPNQQALGAGLRSKVVFCSLALCGPLLAQSQGLILAGSVTGRPGDTVSLPLTLVLNAGASIDILGLTVLLSPVGAAPPIATGKLAFTPASGIASPSLSSADPADLILAWLGNLSSGPARAVSGDVPLGTIQATIPSTALNGQAYSVQFARVEADLMSRDGSVAPVPLTSISAAIGPISNSMPLPPVIQPSGILNAASLSSAATVSPGSIGSLFGLNLAASEVIGTAVPPDVVLGTTQLLFNGIPAPLFYVSPTQINFQMPTNVTGATVQAAVLTNGVSSLTTSVQVAPVAPGIFSLTANGSGPGAVLNEDYSVNSSKNPAAAGSAIMIYATGLGPTDPPFTTGQPGGSSPANRTVQTPDVLINGTPAQVLYSGLAPGFTGEYQVNAVVPAGTPAGSAIPLQIRIDGQSSNTVTIAVK